MSLGEYRKVKREEGREEFQKMEGDDVVLLEEEEEEKSKSEESDDENAAPRCATAKLETPADTIGSSSFPQRAPIGAERRERRGGR